MDKQDAVMDTQVGGNHYKDFQIQPTEFIDANNIPFLEGNVIKYICRHSKKGGLQDLEKASHYLEMVKKARYGGGLKSNDKKKKGKAHSPKDRQ